MTTIRAWFSELTDYDRGKLVGIGQMAFVAASGTLLGDLLEHWFG